MEPQDAGEPNTELRLLRNDMDGIPQYELPEGYRFRTYRDGDEKTWLDLHIAGEPFVDMTPDLFRNQFDTGADVLPERMYFVETVEGVPAGSITAWWDQDRYGVDERGRIHWVIVHPDHRRLGIAKAMMTQAMFTLGEHYRWAMLDTSSGRPVALRMYLDFGFVPDPAQLSDPEVLAGWQRVQAVIRHPVLAEVLAEAEFGKS